MKTLSIITVAEVNGSLIASYGHGHCVWYGLDELIHGLAYPPVCPIVSIFIYDNYG